MIRPNRQAFTFGLLVLFLTLALSACAGGGSDGGGGSLPPSQQQTGTVVCGPVIDITPVSSTNDALTTSDCTVEALFPGSGDGTFVDQYRITLPSGGRLTVRMTSMQFDTLLVLLPSPLQLSIIAIDDDGGGGTDSLITMELDKGAYIILANSALVNPVTGSYTLTTTFDPAWTPTSLTSSPDARNQHTAVWTGSEMIIWGGFDPFSGVKNTGARFDPVSNTWTPITTTGAPSARMLHTAVWTGTEMIVWGGFDGATLNDGAKYDPKKDTWTPLANVAQPSVRVSHTAVWTGKEMIVWGGWSCLACTNGQLQTGARYNPATDAWTPTATKGTPAARANHTAIWTGSKMVVWGGENDPVPLVILGDGGSYDPVTDNWVATNLVGAPPPTRCHSAAWTGSEMIIFGGQLDANLACDISSTSSGRRYDPSKDSWSPMSTAPISSSIAGPRIAWAGNQLVAWFESSGARYNPTTDSWSGVTSLKAPSSRRRHSLVWTGANVIVWGGDWAGTLDTGGMYDPANDSTP